MPGVSMANEERGSCLKPYCGLERKIPHNSICLALKGTFFFWISCNAMRRISHYLLWKCGEVLRNISEAAINIWNLLTSHLRNGQTQIFSCLLIIDSWGIFTYLQWKSCWMANTVSLHLIRMYKLPSPFLLSPVWQAVNNSGVGWNIILPVFHVFTAQVPPKVSYHWMMVCAHCWPTWNRNTPCSHLVGTEPAVKVLCWMLSSS